MSPDIGLMKEDEAYAFIHEVIESLEKKGIFYYTERKINKGNTQYLELELSIKLQK